MKTEGTNVCSKHHDEVYGGTVEVCQHCGSSGKEGMWIWEEFAYLKGSFSNSKPAAEYI
jgi:NMD protein affecting ribosome stability and mRNA decay